MDSINKSPYCKYHKCAVKDCPTRCVSNGFYCTKHYDQYYPYASLGQKNSNGKSSKYGSGSNTRSSNKSGAGNRSNSRNKSSSRKSSSYFDPDDHDIESYYDDYRDEYDDYDDAYDGFMDDDDAWDDY